MSGGRPAEFVLPLEIKPQRQAHDLALGPMLTAALPVQQPFLAGFDRDANARRQAAVISEGNRRQRRRGGKGHAPIVIHLYTNATRGCG